eukprot:TRINITY_DN12277_c0_g1_i6.p1 TRINITY_DN12277_c0_g1~~TRINITY_DN12277_c0_g1_i6.p1  ORF type:complete len:191 (-),score=49.07 TRINITY_DN12277_c0_g1_i6:109-681(-)
MIGNSGVGKSCLLMRYVENAFTDNYFNTIGVDFKIKPLIFGKSRIRLQIWDTAGQERFRTLTSSYYKGTHGIIVVYDIAQSNSFKNVKGWMGEIQKFANEDVLVMIMGNKADLQQKREVSYEEGLALAKEYNVPFMETSAKSGLNVNDGFMSMAKTIYDKQQSRDKKARNQPEGNVITINIKQSNDRCCV